MNRKTVFSILLLCAMLLNVFGMAAPAAAAAGDYTLSAAPKFVNAGETFTVDVVLDEAPAASLKGWQFSMAWNPAVVRLNSWTEDKSCLNAAAVAAGGDTFRVAGTINQGAGTLTAGAVSSLGYAIGLVGATGCKIANMNFTSIANGKANLTFAPVILYNAASAQVPASDITINGGFIQVGPAPMLSVSSVVFTPTGAQGAQFKASVTVANTAATAYPGGDNLNWSITGATGGSPASPIALPAIGANSSTSFDLTGFELAAGVQNAVLSITIPAFGQSKSATYSPVSDSGNTPVDATFGAFINITPDSAINFGKLALGANSVAGNLNVMCNTSYQVDVFDNSNAWKMTQFDGTQYKALKLIESLHIVSAQNDVAAGTPAKLVIGGVAGQSGDAGQNFPMTYSQVLKYADPLLSAGETYHTVLTFNGYVTL